MTTPTNTNYGRKLSQGSPALKSQIQDLLLSAVSNPNNPGANNYLVAVSDLLSLITKATVGLDRVDNTPDEAKPISLATHMALTEKANAVHQHALSDIDGLDQYLDNLINGASISITQVEGLAQALTEKAEAVHGHSIENIAGLSQILDAKADRTHGHSLNDINGAVEALQTIWQALNQKAEINHTHNTAQIDGLDSTIRQIVAEEAGNVGSVDVGNMEW